MNICDWLRNHSYCGLIVTQQRVFALLHIEPSPNAIGETKNCDKATNRSYNNPHCCRIACLFLAFTVYQTISAIAGCTYFSILTYITVKYEL